MFLESVIGTVLNILALTALLSKYLPVQDHQ